ncbi:MAG: efflux RND transporter permease subunit [Bradymonadia bacterium]
MNTPEPTSALERAIDLMLRRRRVVALVLACVTLALGAGMLRLGFDFSPQAFFETGDDDDRYQKSMVEAFGHADDLVMVIVRHDEGALQRTALEHVAALTERMQAEPWVAQVQSIVTTPIVQPPKAEFDPIIVAPMTLDALVEGGAALQADPLIGGVLLSTDGKATAVLVEVDEAIRKVSELEPLMTRLEALVADHPPPQGVTVQIYGLPHLRVEAVGLLIRDQITLLPIVMVLFIGVLYLLFRRRWIAVIAPFAAIALVLLWVPGLMGHLDAPINLLSNVLPLLLFTLGISDAIHLMTRYAEEHDGGLEGGVALHRSTVKLAGACFLTSFTTAVGFASLCVSRTALLREFGLLTAAGVVFAYLTTITVVPLILARGAPLKLNDTQPSKTSTGSKLDRVLVALADSVVAHPGRWLASMLPMVAVLGYGITQVQIDSRIHEAFHPDSELYQAQMQAEQALGGLLELGVSIKGDAPGRLKDAEVLQRTWALQQYIEGLEGAGRTVSPATFIRALWVAFRGVEAEVEGSTHSPNLPRTAEELAQTLLIEEMGADPSAKGGLPWHRVMRDDWQHIRISGRLADKGSGHFLPLFEEIEAEAQRLFGDLPGVSVRLTGEGLVASRALQYYIEDLLGSLGIAAVIIFFAMVILFRSLPLGLLSVIPNMFPLLCAFGFMGLFDYPLNTTTVITFSISLGLAVDDTIHFLVRYREERRRRPRHEAVHEALVRTGRPIIMTTVLLCLGVSVITTSAFLATAHFGQLVLVAIACALPGDLVILPALLALGDRAPSKKGGGS